MKQPQCFALELYMMSFVWFMEGTQMLGGKLKKKVSMPAVTT